MNAYRNASFVGIILALIGIVLIVYGLSNYGTEKKLDQKGLSAKGVVYELNVVEPYRQAMVEFTTQDGNKVQFIDKLYWNHSFNKYQVGQEVEVIYDPADPIATATINEFFQRNTAPWWPFILGVFLIIIGVIFRRTMKSKARVLDGQRNGTISYSRENTNRSMNRIMLVVVFVILTIIGLLIYMFSFSNQ